MDNFYSLKLIKRAKTAKLKYKVLTCMTSMTL